MITYNVVGSTLIKKNKNKYTLHHCNSGQVAKDKGGEMIADDQWEYLTKDKTEKEIDDMINFIL